MSKKHNVFLSSAAAVERYDLNLKNRVLAGVLAWLVPGLGHFYQGRNLKGALFVICITSLLLFGVYVGQSKGETGPDARMINVAFAPTESMAIPTSISQAATFVTNHWKFICQSGVGAVFVPAMVQRYRVLHHEAPLAGGVFSPPRMDVDTLTSQDGQGNEVVHPTELAKWNYDAGFYFELGSIYTVIAGLLNILVVYDAACGPLVAVSHVDEDPDSPDPEPA